ncbi:DUF3284 domain-containing protein [Alkalicella caledoniensis]|uniref:DUF3284 domain-containing protein n=1 Tax=Alkalicella caledoniensis TaxID=2731377 RepID=A0A7G9W7I6_ALKCA|nr:DUF3284 domain-containing protein [Alkalicella caledoniensis]QNO14648.1 DUF3284 domain-containing protein [Alkalicella caledoniensis]
MSTFKNEAVMNYPVEQVFRVFKETAKRDFPNFDEQDPIGTYVERNIGAYSVKQAKMKVEITDFKNNEIYEISSYQGKTLYKSKYQFISTGENSSKLILEENQYNEGAVNFLNTMIGAIFFKGRVKKRFKFLIKGLQDQIEKNSNCST